MLTKIFHRIGLAACIALTVCCFLPWTYYADIDQTFTGVYSYGNEYGKPGVFLVALATIAFIFMQLPKLWAKRANLFVCALCVGYAIKTYIIYTACYNTFCPEKKAGIYIMLLSALLMMGGALSPNFKLEEKSNN